jgi:hypothetical protein
MDEKGFTSLPGPKAFLKGENAEGCVHAKHEHLLVDFGCDLPSFSKTAWPLECSTSGSEVDACSIAIGLIEDPIFGFTGSEAINDAIE